MRRINGLVDLISNIINDFFLYIVIKKIEFDWVLIYKSIL